MTNCYCCSAPVWVMHGPAMCDGCKDAGCDPSGPGSIKHEFNSDFGSLTIVEKANPCRRGMPWCTCTAKHECEGHR